MLIKPKLSLFLRPCRNGRVIAREIALNLSTSGKMFFFAALSLDLGPGGFSGDPEIIFDDL